MTVQKLFAYNTKTTEYNIKFKTIVNINNGKFNIFLGKAFRFIRVRFNFKRGFK